MLNGGGGHDWLDGSEGNDTLTGGEGSDGFVFGDGDTIVDFGNRDVIDIRHFGDINADSFEASVAIRQRGEDVEVQIGDAVLTLSGVNAADITADDFILA